MKKTTFLFLILTLAACGENADHTSGGTTPDTMVQTATADSLTNELTALVENGPIHGFGVAIVDGTGIRYARGFGFADLSADKPYTAHTIQNIGSVSKTLIGIALLKAGELGKLQLDDLVNDHLPFAVSNPYHPDVPITIRHLATHTSTILDTDYYNERAYAIHDDADLEKYDLSEVGETFNTSTEKVSMATFLKNLLARDGAWYSHANYMTQEPGALFEYSNVGATLAAYIIEEATGSTYDEFTRMHILEPLGMSDSGWSLDKVDLSKHSVLYSRPEVALPKYSLVTYPDGGLLASATDLGKYLSELIKGQAGRGNILRAESYQELFREQLDGSHLPDREAGNPYDDEYNSGVFMGISSPGYLGHTGGDPGIASLMFFNPETGIGKFMMINTSIVSEEGFQQFISVWTTLEQYENKIAS